MFFGPQVLSIAKYLCVDKFSLQKKLSDFKTQVQGGYKRMVSIILKSKEAKN